MRFRIKNHVIILVINVMRNHLLDNWILKVFGNVMFERQLIPTWCPINSMKKKRKMKIVMWFMSHEEGHFHSIFLYS